VNDLSSELLGLNNRKQQQQKDQSFKEKKINEKNGRRIKIIIFKEIIIKPNCND